MATEARINITAKDRTRGALGSARQGLTSLKSAVFSVQGAIAGLAGAAGFGTLVKQSLKTGDALGKTADKLGTTTKALAGLRLAAARTADVTSKTLDTALQRALRRTSEFEMGTGEAKTALEELGFAAGDFAGLGVDKRFSMIADAMQGVTDQGDRVRLSMKLFDTEGVALESTLRLGSEGLAEYAAQAEKFGTAISRVDASKMEAANDAIANIGESTKGIGLQITAGLAPALTLASEKFLALSTDTNNWAKTTEGAVRFSLNAFDLLREGVNVLEGAFNLLGVGVNQAFSKMAAGIAWVFEKFSMLASYLPGEFYNKMSEGYAAVAESALIFSEITGDAAQNFHDQVILNTEAMGTFAETSVERYDAVAAAAEKSSTRQVVALKSLSAATRKQLDENGKWLAKEAAAKTTADQQKGWSQQQYTRAAVSAGNALFENNKGVKAGLIVADTASAIMGAMSQLPWPANLAAAASAAAMGAAQLAAVRSASKGGGGGGGAAVGAGNGGGAVLGNVGGGGGAGGAGGSPANPTLQDTAATTNTTSTQITLQGGLYGREEIRELIEKINEETGDGANLEVAA